MWTEEKLDALLTEPSQALIEDVKKIKGDIMVLGAGGKMGPTLCLLAKKAIEKISGIRCGFKSTSCPNELAKAIAECLGE